MTQSRSNYSFLLFLLAIGFAFAGLPLIQYAQSNKGAVHASVVHGAAAELADNCYNQHGAKQIWKQRTNGRIHLLCQYPGETNYYDVVLEQHGKSWEKATSHALSDQKTGRFWNWTEIKNYLHDNIRKAFQIKPEDLPIPLPSQIP